MSKANALNVGRFIYKFATYANNLGQLVPHNTLVYVQFNINQEVQSHITKNGSGDEFTVNEAGIYTMYYKVRVNNNGTASNSQFMSGGIQVNGSTISRSNAALDIGIPTNGTIALTDSVSVQHTQRFNVGDTIRFWAFQTNNISTDRNISADSSYNILNISKVGI